MKKKTKSILKKGKQRKTKNAKKGKKTKTEKRVKFDLSKSHIGKIENKNARLQNNLYNLTALALLFSKHFKPIFENANAKPEIRYLIRKQYGGAISGASGEDSSPATQGLSAINEIQTTALNLINTLKDGGIKTLMTGVSVTDKVLGNYINQILNQIVPGISDKKWNEVAPLLQEKIKTLSDVMTKFITDYKSGNNPEFEAAVNNMVKLLGEISETLITQIEPEFNKITEKLGSMAKKTASTSGKAAVSAGMNFIKSGAAAIPVVGGLVNLMFAFGSMFNAATRIFYIFINTNSENAVSFTKAGKKSFETLSKGIPAITERIGEVTKTFDKLQGVAAIPGAQQMATNMVKSK